MLPNDSSKLKTPELSSDILNALADPVDTHIARLA